MKGFDINGEFLPLAEVQVRAAALRLERGLAGEDLAVDDRLAIQDEAAELLVDRVLLIQDARRLGLQPTAEDVAAALAQLVGRSDGIAGCRTGADTVESRRDIEQRLMVDRVLDEWRKPVAKPRTAEVSAYYKGHRTHFCTPELVHASHIVRNLVDGEPPDAIQAVVEQLRRRVLAGEAMGQLAAESSDCPENNGDLGWFARGVMVAEFDAAVFTAPIGKLTDVFATAFGFHFAIVHERRAAGPLALEEVRSQIEESLWLRKQDQAVGQRLANLRAKATIRRVR